MCRLLGITDFEYSRHGKIVDNFCELARTGHVMAGDPPGHEDGWGMAFYREGSLVVQKSGRNLSEETDRVKETLKRVGGTPALILHLRKSAWSDSSSTRHAHPFSLGNAVFAHNGTVYEFRKLLPDITVPGLGEDALDTEAFFYHFLSWGLADLGQAFLKSVAVVKERCRYSALNCLFSDGKKLFAYRDYAKEPDYYSLFKARSGNSYLVSSEPLDEDLRWETMEKGEFLEIPLG